MMKYEFEALVGRTVTPDQYKAIEALYIDSTMSKQDFVKSIKPLLKGIPEVKKSPVLTMAFHNCYGDMKTPNGCYYLTKQVELLNVDIRAGKKHVRIIPDSFELRSSYDMTDWDYGVTFE